jgi:predicted SprT family Zn-dependent metalloprotease
MELEKLVRDIQKKHFPELKDMVIQLIPKESLNTTMEVSPFSDNVRFNPAKVKANTDEENWATIGHEFCHFVQYRKMNFFQKVAHYVRVGLLKDIKHLSKIEKEADRMAIKKGFGPALVKARRKGDKMASKKFLAIRRKIYYSPEELEKLIKQMK